MPSPRIVKRNETTRPEGPAFTQVLDEDRAELGKNHYDGTSSKVSVKHRRSRALRSKAFDKRTASFRGRLATVDDRFEEVP